MRIFYKKRVNTRKLNNQKISTDIEGITNQTIIDLFTGIKSGSKIQSILNKNTNVRYWLQLQIKDNDLFEDIFQYIHFIVDNIKLPLCPVCNKTLTFKQFTKGTTYCNYDCLGKCQSLKQRRKETVLSIYGVTNNYNCPHIKQEFLEKHGVSNPGLVPEFRLKQQQTCIERYGHQNVLAAEYGKQLTKQHYLNNYNVEHNMQVPFIKEKAIKSKLDTSYNKIKDSLKDTYQLLTTREQFLGTGHQYTWKCNKCDNIFESKYHNGILYKKCLNCYSTKGDDYSVNEKQVADFCSQYFNIRINDRQIISPLELDVVIADINLAIEYNGMYWHSTTIRPDINYHLNKLNLCLDNNIKLIHIFENVWLQKTEQVKHLLLNRFNKLDNLTRDVIIQQIDQQQSILFNDKYGLNDLSNDNYFIGMFLNNELVSILSGTLDDHLQINALESMFNSRSVIPLFLNLIILQ